MLELPYLSPRARPFLALPAIFLDRPLEVEGHRPEEDARGRVARQVREDLVGCLAPGLGATQRDRVVVLATHGGGPLPQRPATTDVTRGANWSATTVTSNPWRARQRALVSPLTPAPMTTTPLPALARYLSAKITGCLSIRLLSFGVLFPGVLFGTSPTGAGPAPRDRPKSQLSFRLDPLPDALNAGLLAMVTRTGDSRRTSSRSAF